MLFLHRWKFFSNKGNDLNLSKVQKITVTIVDSTGRNAKLQPITDQNGDLIFLEIINSGLGYTSPVITLTDNITNETHTVSSYTLDGNGGIASITLGSPTAAAWSYPSFTYEGDLYFNKKISANLIENEHIFVIEEVVDPITTKLGYVYPRFNSANGKLRWKWSDEPTTQPDEDALFMFNVDTESSLTPFIEKVDNLDFTLDNGTGDALTSGKKLWRNIQDTNDTSIQANVAISYPSEGVFERFLELYDYTDTTNPSLLVRLKVLGEVIPEDERFVTILDNLGQRINAEEEFIFRDSDINEDVPDVDLLNKKRKEFILEHSNIIPYIGSYKAIFNVINWLGYNDLRLKEYFLNIAEDSINYNKRKPADIPFDIAQKGGDYRSLALMPSSKYKKTNLFGLYYDINRESGELDSFGIPETEDAFMFTIEEVLIKLFALKKYLKNKFLPLNARIIDIVGEGIYFERYRVNSWTDGTRILDFDLTREAKFTCEPHEANVIDLRELEDYDYFQPAVLKATVDQTNSNKPLYGIFVVDPGYGYIGDLNVNPNGTQLNLLIEGGYYTSPASAVATIDTQTGSITSITINDYGSGYAAAPSVTVTPEPTKPNDQTVLKTIQNNIIGFFDGINKIKKFPDKPNLPVGAPIKLKTSTFDITWDDIQYSWDSFFYDFKPAIITAVITGGVVTGFTIDDSGQGYLVPPTITIKGGNPSTTATATATITGGKVTALTITNTGAGYTAQPTVEVTGGVPVSDLNTWDTIGIGDFYEMEWIINGPRGYNYRKRGRVDVLREHTIIVPYVGEYDVEMILYDTDNNWTNAINKSCFKVKLPEIEFTTFGRFGQCRESWDEMNMTWDEANFMWINPVKHDVTWDDLDLTWDDLELKNYKNYLTDLFPSILEKPVKRLSETDRYFGTIKSIDTSIKEIVVSNPSSRPVVETGDFLYFRQGSNTFRTNVVDITYDYAVENIEVVTSGSYQITYNPTTSPTTTVSGSWVGTPQSHPVAIIDPPTMIGGTQANGNVIIDGSITNIIVIGSNAGYKYYVGGGTTPPPSIQSDVTYASVTHQVYNIIFGSPSDPGGVVAGGPALFNQGSFIGWFNGNYSSPGTVSSPLALGFPFFTGGAGSGYNTPPQFFKIIDGNGNEVINTPDLAPDNLDFEITITGGISKIDIVDSGSGYVSVPNILIDPAVPTLPSFIANVTDVPSEATLIVDSLPLGLNSSWDILREIGRSIIVQGDCVYDPINNANGIKVGDWLKLRGEDNVPKIKRIPISSDFNSFLGLRAGVILSGDYSNFITGEKCNIYRVRNIDFGTGMGADDFWVDDLTNQITIYNPSFDPMVEITPGFHELVLRNWNSTTGIFDYEQRVLIVHIEKVGNDYVLDVDPIDGDLGLFVTDSLSELEYQYFDFPAVVDEAIISGTDTNVVLNFNDWPEHDTFNPSVDQWYIDYGNISGDWALLVTDIGKEGNDTIINVDDPNSELWRSSTSFLLGWRNFDEDYAERRVGIDNLNWTNMDEVTWDDMCHLTWDMLEYNNQTHCGFRINKVSPNGRIQWNEEPVFELSGVTGTMTTVQKINQAVSELNDTDNSGLSRFYYTAMPNSTNPTYIMASAKYPGGDSLGYIRFGNGTEGEYSADPTLSHTFPLHNTDNSDWLSGLYGPNNKPGYWDIVRRVYDEFGVDPIGNVGWYPSEKLPKKYDSNKNRWISERIPYLNALGGAFKWSETYVSPRNSKIPTYTTMFFTATGCDIMGKTEYRWNITNVKTGEVLIESVKPVLIWTFTQLGMFDVSLEIVDTNGNVKSKTRKGFIKTYRPSEEVLI